MVYSSIPILYSQCVKGARVVRVLLIDSRCIKEWRSCYEIISRKIVILKTSLATNLILLQRIRQIQIQSNILAPMNYNPMMFHFDHFFHLAEISLHKCTTLSFYVSTYQDQQQKTKWINQLKLSLIDHFNLIIMYFAHT